MSGNVVKIKFVDMPGEFDEQNNFILDILRERYTVEFSDRPDFLFYSVFGIEYLAYRDCVRIFLDGEPVLPNFNDCDYAIGYTYMTLGDRYLRAAGVLASSVGKELPRQIQDRSLVHPGMARRKFCNFIYSNGTKGEGAKLRIDFCKKLMEYKHVDCPGLVLNNMSSDALAKRYEGYAEGGDPIVSNNDWQDSKQEFLKGYKFTIAFENVRIPGMTTEKLINPFFAYSVPIYWGNPEAAKEYDPKAFVDCAAYGDDLDAVVERIKELDQDDEQYLEMLRRSPLQPDYDFSQREKLKSFLYKIVERGNAPVRNPTAVDCWEPVSANLILRWGDSYQKVHDALTYAAANADGLDEKMAELDAVYGSNSWKLLRKMQRFADSKWGYLPKKLFLFLLGAYRKVKGAVSKS